MVRYNNNSSTANVIKTSNALLTDSAEIANHLGEHFQNTSSDASYAPEFLALKINKESLPPAFQIDPLHALNHPFSFTELTEALQSRKDTAPGPDNICIGMIRNLTVENKKFILLFLNKIFISGKMPTLWAKSICIPILKKDKPRDLVTSYRIISLTCSLCKLLEKMICNRLHWFLERQNLFIQWQSGFRQNRSTRDNLVKLEMEIREAFHKKQKLLAVFIDIQNAFDCVWRRNIIDSLIKLGIQGHMAIFIQNFLSNRNFIIRNGNSISNQFVQKNGVPQGSVLSPILFSIVISEVLRHIPLPVKGMLYADDLVVYCTGKSVNDLQSHVQNCLTSISQWLKNHGFNISPSKTASIIFSTRKVESPPLLFINDIPIEYKDNFKFLGLSFDRNLNWCSQIKSLRIRCLRSLNILKMMTNLAWGGDRISMMMLYRSLVRSKLDYGCMAYASASERTLLMLNSVHHSGLRIATGAFRSSPGLSILAESGEPPLDSRRDLLSLNYYMSIRANPYHPLNEYFDRLPGLPNPQMKKKSFIFRILSLLQEHNMDASLIMQEFLPENPPWTISPPSVNLGLTKFLKKDTNPIIFKAEFIKISSQTSVESHVFTDGSKSLDGVGAACVTESTAHMFSLHPYCSIFTAELLAISKALDTITPFKNKLSIFSDSLSTLIAITHIYDRHPIVTEILRSIHNLGRTGCSVFFTWIPSHCGIKGNEKADSFAKKATKNGIQYPCVPLNDYKFIVKNKIMTQWGLKWWNTTENKLREIKSTTVAWGTSAHGNRRNEVVLTRLRIGHTRLTHSYLMTRDSPPICNVCGVELSVKHILTECLSFTAQRQKHEISGGLDEILSDNPHQVDKLINFLKSSELLKNI